MAQHIVVHGNFERIIRLETGVDLAFAYLTDFNYILPRLPEIDRVLRYSDGRYRMIFGADDGRGHAMGIVFDIRHELSPNQHIRMVAIPLTERELHADTRLANNGPLFPGRFSGETLFNESPGHTEIIYRVTLQIEVQVPSFLSFMPHRVLQQIGDTMMRVKLRQVGDGLANGMTQDFEEWRELNAEKMLATVGGGVAQPPHHPQTAFIRTVEAGRGRPANELN